MEVIQIDPEKVKDNPYQPRKGYSTKKIDEIASSIEQNGLLETPLGRRHNGDVELAFGHIRKRSFIKLKKKNPKKWPTMPVELREISDREMAIFALEENLKRIDITPIDLARSVTRYFEVFPDATEADLAKKLSMTQGNISNMRRVMRLPDEILQKIDEGRIIFTMARELLIFEGLSAAGKESRWSHKEERNIDIPKDSKWLMLDAVKNVATPGTEGRYGTYPATVEGMQKAIHDTVKENFKPLGTGSNYGTYRTEEVLFDVEKAGCKTCESSIKTHPMKSQACSWCTKPKCWEKKQEAHKEKRAAEAKKKMEEDILAKAAAAEVERQAKVGISREIPGELREPVTAVDREIEEMAIKQEPQKEAPLAAKKVPEDILALTMEKAGSRAEILDLNELRAGSWGELKQGYVLLDNTLKIMDHPVECLETCTKGFHYAFDSREQPSWRQEQERKVSYVCTDPKCVSKKKAAYTRALNADGQAKKKAEVAAIKQALSETTKLDKARMKVIIAGLIQTQSLYYYSNNREIDWFAKKLNIDKKEVPGTGFGATDAPKLKAVLFQKLDGLSEEELAKIILEFSFTRLMFAGDIKEYKILTTEALNWLGIGINIEKEKNDTAAQN